MHVVVIHGWREESPALVQMLAATLGITAFEARQRMVGGGPAVVASFADPGQARALAGRLGQGGLTALVIDAAAVHGGGGRFNVRRFQLGARSLCIEAADGRSAEIPYGEIDLLLAGTGISGQTETVKVTERKLSLGATIMSGGIPVTRKVERREEVTTEQRTKLLYLYAGSRPQIVFSQSGMTYDGLGSAMKMSRELNFAFLTAELHRLAPGARCDDRLINRAGQVRVLGVALNAETHLDLAAEILARTLRIGQEANQ